MAIERGQMFTKASKVKESVYAAKQVTTRNVIFKIEGIEELILRSPSDPS